MSYKKFMFDLDFGPPTARARVEAALVEPEHEIEEDMAPPPTFSEEDLQVVRESAYEEGYQAGIAEARAGVETALAQAMTRSAEALAALREAQEVSADEANRVAAKVAMAVLRRVLPATCEQHAFEEVVHAVTECFAMVLDEPRIIVKTESELVDPVRERLESMAVTHGFEGRVVVQADQRLAKGDCKVEWADGGAERDQARLMADIEAAVERALARPEAG